MKNKYQVITINGHSGSGKTTLAKSLIDKSFIELDLLNENIHDFLLEDDVYDVEVINRGKPEILFDRLRYADPRVIRLEIKNNEDSKYIIAIINDNGNEKEVLLSNVSKRYRTLLNLILLIRNKKNIFIDNFDFLFVGSNFRKVVEMIIREIKLSKIKIVLTSTDIGVWQLFSLCLPKEMSKTFYMTTFSNKTNSFEHMNLDYVKLAYTLNIMYDQNIKRLLENEEDKERPLRPADMKDY